MSIKIRVSYTDDEELAGVIRLLSPLVKSWKIKPQKGRYKLAYISLRNTKVEPQNANIEENNIAENADIC